MIGTWIERQIVKVERQTGESADWLREVAAQSPAAFFKFAAFMPLARHNAAAPVDAAVVARIAATKNEDCGPCVQTVVNYAVAAGVDSAVIQAVLDGAPERLTDDLAAVYRYAVAVAKGAPEAAERVEDVRRRYGDAALVDLALGIAAVRVFPTAKRGLGHAMSCAQARIETRDKREPADA